MKAWTQRKVTLNTDQCIIMDGCYLQLTYCGLHYDLRRWSPDVIHPATVTCQSARDMAAYLTKHHALTAAEDLAARYPAR